MEKEITAKLTAGRKQGVSHKTGKPYDFPIMILEFPNGAKLDVSESQWTVGAFYYLKQELGV